MSGIIVGVDGSGHSHRALEWAVSEAATRHAPLTVLTVLRPVPTYWGEPVPFPEDPEIVDQARKELQRATDAVLDHLDAAARPPSVQVRVVTGPPAGELLAAARGADLLVVGARGAGGFKRLLLGSVSSHAAHHAPCPVVIIRDGKD